MGVPGDPPGDRPAGQRRVHALNDLVSVTASVPDVDAAVTALTDLLGYRQRARLPVTAEIERRWGIAPGSAGDERVLLAAEGAGTGMLELVRGEPRQRQGRLPARWAGVELVVRDVDALAARAAESAAFTVVHEPATIDLSQSGSLVHRSAAVEGPGGIMLMFTQALSEPEGRSFHTAWAEVGPIFAAHLRLSDGDAALRLYRDDLGLQPLLSLPLDSGWWHEYWHLPDGVHVDVHVLKPHGTGTVEVQVYPVELLDDVPVPQGRLDGGIGLVTLSRGDAEVRVLIGPSGERLQLVADHSLAMPPR